MKRNIIILDTETSGLDPNAGAEIVQIAADAIRYTDLSDHHSGPFNVFIKPERPDLASAEAIKIIGSVWDQAMEEGIPRKIALEKFLEWCRTINHDGKKFSTNPIGMGHNFSFDDGFLKHYIQLEQLIKKDKKGFYNYPWSLVF